MHDTHEAFTITSCTFTIQEPHHVYFGPTSARPLLSREFQAHTCDLVELPRVYQRFNNGMVFRKDSEFFDIFHHFFLNLVERGQSRRLLQKWLDARNEVKSCAGDGGNALSFKSVVSAFVLVLIGALLALLLTLGEFVDSRSRQSFRPRSQQRWKGLL